jgi:hypothetical protein
MNLLLMCEKFEQYIGPLNMINLNNPYLVGGLHRSIEISVIPAVIEMNKENIIIVLRDSKLTKLI